MGLIEKLRNRREIKYSFGKNNEWNDIFSREIGSFNMNTPGYGLSIPSNLTAEYKIRGIFLGIMRLDGIFTFNISNVDIKRAMIGFNDFEEASGNNMITEWELFIILNRPEYLKMTVFHNAVNEFVITKRGIKIKWN